VDYNIIPSSNFLELGSTFDKHTRETMKKILIATTALVATAGVAAADVTLSGYGRFGLDHNSGATGPATKTQINSRFRLNIDATTETDSGVTFGGRVRLQYQSNRLNGVSANSSLTTVNVTSGASLNAAQFYASYAGMRVEVGNANTAIDSVALMYNSEIGYLDRSFGNPIGGFEAYASYPYEADITGADDVASSRMGVFASYSLGAGTVRASLINPNQALISSAMVAKKEASISADYTFGQFTVAAAYADNAAFEDNATSAFIGASYAVTPDANVGLLYFQDENSANQKQTRTTIYGNYKMDAMTFKGYIAHDDSDEVKVGGNETDTAFGLGMDYDLGGARLSGDIHRNYDKDTIVGLGVRFDF
jgi:outer membrane protein OmpU